MRLEEAVELADLAWRTVSALDQQIRMIVEEQEERAARRKGELVKRFNPPKDRSPKLAFGVTRTANRQGWRMAVRAWDEVDRSGWQHIWELATGGFTGGEEPDVQVVGPIEAPRPFAAGGGAAPGAADLRRRKRPLHCGQSIGHPSITAGTLGAFVRRGSRDETLILSNNHVLAATNAGGEGDAVLQPGPYHRGTEADSAVGRLLGFIKLERSEVNYVDAALAAITEDDALPDDLAIPGIGRLEGINNDLDSLDEVQKVGCRTGRTTGRVTGFFRRPMPVRYGDQVYWFGNTIEVEGVGRPFSRGGDSGSLVVDEDRNAVGLLFAGSTTKTYLNPISLVLEDLGVGFIA